MERYGMLKEFIQTDSTWSEDWKQRKKVVRTLTRQSGTGRP